jgi:hypothetical protein
MRNSCKPSDISELPTYELLNTFTAGCYNAGAHILGAIRKLHTVIVVTTSVKQDETGGQGHTSASLLHQSAT